MKENIEEDLKIVEKLIKTMEQDRITFKDEQSKEIYAYFINALANILSDYKRLQEEFRQVDHECFRLEQKELRLEKENEELKEKWDKDTHKLQNDLDIANAEKIELQKENEKLERANKCYINSIQSIAPVLLQDYIEKQKIKDKIEELNKKIASEENEKVILWLHKQRNVLQDVLEDKEG